MKTNSCKLNCIAGSLGILAVLMIFWIPAAPVLAVDAPAVPESADSRFVSIDFNNVDINVFIKFISELTGRNFVVDERVKGQVTIISPAKISVDEAYAVFLSVLEVNGYTTVKAGSVTKIVPSPDARSKNIKTLLKSEAGAPEDRVVTQLIHLKYAQPEEIKQLFTPLISKSSVILSYSPTGTLIVTDVYSNIQRLMRILGTIDIPGIGHEISVVPVRFAEAVNLVKILDSMFQTTSKTAKKNADTGKTVKFMADERTNAIVFLASKEDTERVSRLIGVLDRETPRGQGAIHVYYLENADAEELAEVLQDLPAQTETTEKGKNTAVVSEKVKIRADAATNSLIITAEKDDYRVLDEVIKKLDIPRAMVYIEALIMEINADKDFRLGTEWAVGDTTSGGDVAVVSGFSGGASGGDAGYDNLSEVYTDGVSLPGGFSMGVFGEAITIGSTVFPSIGAMIEAYDKDEDVHILSTPQILTTDNEKASIVVGKNVPYQTTTSTTDNDTYNSYEYKDVGKTLEITPQISKDGTIRLELKLTVETLESTTDYRPTTLKRTLETTVMVKNKNTVVLGGLIDDTTTNTIYKVPCLGDLPLVSWLFKSTADTESRTNLYIFMTPRVVNTQDQAQDVYKEKIDYMQGLSSEKIKMYDSGKAHTETETQP